MGVRGRLQESDMSAHTQQSRPGLPLSGAPRARAPRPHAGRARACRARAAAYDGTGMRRKHGGHMLGANSGNMVETVMLWRLVVKCSRGLRRAVN